MSVPTNKKQTQSATDSNKRTPAVVHKKKVTIIEEEEDDSSSGSDVDALSAEIIETFDYVKNLLTLGYTPNARESALLDKVEKNEDVEALLQLAASMEKRMVHDNQAHNLKSVYGNNWWKNFLNAHPDEEEFVHITKTIESNKAFTSKKLSRAEEEILSKYAQKQEMMMQQQNKPQQASAKRPAPPTRKDKSTTTGNTKMVVKRSKTEQ